MKVYPSGEGLKGFKGEEGETIPGKAGRFIIHQLPRSQRLCASLGCSCLLRRLWSDH